uniref:Uncharacterized protein n=1 Tax=Megaselia scalaris TaxID=36166 RepID=T1GBR8_MEGSC
MDEVFTYISVQLQLQLQSYELDSLHFQSLRLRLLEPSCKKCVTLMPYALLVGLILRWLVLIRRLRKGEVFEFLAF